ncbi:hypothetical protein HPY1846_00020 (plasmid) [Helicobacter pylori]|nr:hypothetical protein HPY1846_00020 [Helicobacter pylori]
MPTTPLFSRLRKTPPLKKVHIFFFLSVILPFFWVLKKTPLFDEINGVKFGSIKAFSFFHINEKNFH